MNHEYVINHLSLYNVKSRELFRFITIVNEFVNGFRISRFKLIIGCPVFVLRRAERGLARFVIHTRSRRRCWRSMNNTSNSIELHRRIRSFCSLSSISQRDDAGRARHCSPHSVLCRDAAAAAAAATATATPAVAGLPPYCGISPITRE